MPKYDITVDEIPSCSDCPYFRDKQDGGCCDLSEEVTLDQVKMSDLNGDFPEACPLPDEYPDY